MCFEDSNASCLSSVLMKEPEANSPVQWDNVVSAVRTHSSRKMQQLAPKPHSFKCIFASQPGEVSLSIPASQRMFFALVLPFHDKVLMRTNNPDSCVSFPTSYMTPALPIPDSLLSVSDLEIRSPAAHPWHNYPTSSFQNYMLYYLLIQILVRIFFKVIIKM